jgi:transposase
MKTTQVTKKLDFNGDPIYVGLDVHKKQWNVSIMSDLLTHKNFTQPPDPKTLSRYLKENFPNATYYSVYEAGFCGFWIHDALVEEGINNIVVSPADVPTSDKEKRQKTDRVDSNKLCRGLREKSLRGIYVPPRDQLEDRQAVRLRKTLVHEITRCKNRIKGLLNFYGINLPEEFDQHYWSKAFTSWLNSLELSQPSGTLTLRILLEQLQNNQQLIQPLQRHLIELSRQKYSAQVKLLKSIPGIGITAALTIITELVDIRRFRHLDQLCSYVGLIPNIYSSGETEHVGNMTHRKNPFLQPLLIQCAWRSIEKDPALMKAYHDYCKRMKGNKAIIRIARKLLNRIRYVMINQKQYELKTV